VTGTEVVLEAARRNKVHRVLVCSSNIVLSDQRTVYRSTKVAVEALVEAYSSLGVSVLGLRPSNIYGAGQSKTEYQMCAFAGLDSCYAKEGIFRISGDGTQTRDWVHASDVARAFVGSIGFFEATGMTIDIATGVQTSMNAIADMLGVPVVYEKPRLGDAKRLVSDTKRAHDFLMFDAEVPLKTGIWDAFPSLKKP
jgi:nucleoside-diphosphate-sugar epimerase